MKKHIFFVLLLINFFNNQVFAQNFISTLSNEAEISIFTCAPGEELYSTFGHSAIRVHDPANNFDIVFNYGTFNFNTPNFYIKFVKGSLNYQLAIDRYSIFIRDYMEENRSVHEQVLNLSQTQKQKMYSYLVWNVQPENKYYKYDFFFDNCATRIRDVMEKSIGDSLIWDKTFEAKKMTFRDLLNKYLNSRSWTQYGIHVLIGRPADKLADTRESMFLPDFMEDAIAKSTVKTKEGNQPLTKQYNILYESPEKDKNQNGGLKPFLFFWLLLLALIIVTFFELRRKKLFSFIDFTLFFVLGIVGFLIIILWFFTEHKAVVSNLNILWTIPFHAIFAFFIFRETIRKFVKYYFFGMAIYSVLLIGVFFLLPQAIPLPALPIIFITALRSYNIYRVKKTD